MQRLIPTDLRLLLISNSRERGKKFLSHAQSFIKDFLGSKVQELLFIPYASVVLPYDEYALLLRKGFEEWGYKISSIHEYRDPKIPIKSADGIVVGGGNTFHLLNSLYELDLLKCLHERVAGGTPYIGWSAGANIVCPTIKTTNDMPVVWPPSLDCLNLVPFQINPHYTDSNPPDYNGETREERIREFSHLNPNTSIIGLREGGILSVEDGKIRSLGPKKIKVFEENRTLGDFGPSDSLDFLWNYKP